MKAITTAELIGAYIAGASTLALAERYPICRTAIHYRLKRAGVTLRRCGPPLGNQNAKGRGMNEPPMKRIHADERNISAFIAPVSAVTSPPPPSPGGNPIPGDEEYED
jgi:hypothetical protein